MMGLDAAVENDPFPEIALEAARLHAARGRLERLQGVEPDLDERRDERRKPSAAVEHDLEPEVVTQINHPLQVRKEEAPEERLAYHGSVLGAEVVPDEEDVDGAAGGFENPPADLGVIVDNTPEHGVDEVRSIVEEEHEPVHAQEVDGVVIEGRPVPPQDCVSALQFERIPTNMRDVDSSA